MGFKIFTYIYRDIKNTQRFEIVKNLFIKGTKKKSRKVCWEYN